MNMKSEVDINRVKQQLGISPDIVRGSTWLNVPQILLSLSSPIDVEAPGRNQLPTAHL